MKPVVVAVKVRHPEVGESLQIDLKLIKFVARFLKFLSILKWLRLDESVEQFSVFIKSQINLKREADNSSHFIYSISTFKHVSLPKPFSPLLCSNVLVRISSDGNVFHTMLMSVKGMNDLKKFTCSHWIQLIIPLEDNSIHTDTSWKHFCLEAPFEVKASNPFS